jgi:hypothetical protein
MLRSEAATKVERTTGVRSDDDVGSNIRYLGQQGR